MGQPGSTGLVEVQWTFRYQNLEKKLFWYIDIKNNFKKYYFNIFSNKKNTLKNNLQTLTKFLYPLKARMHAFHNQ
jgi:hypothetical protein